MTIRRALPADREALGRLGSMLMHVHYGFDRLRFLHPGADAAEGYAEFLSSQLDDDESVVFVAEDEGVVQGYVYAAIEPLSWKELRDRAGFIHDVAVDASDRRHGVASALLNAALGWFRERKLPRAMLWTSPANAPARAAFARFGFRETMIEMTRELD
jgi:ribosomal protein S18 acetylase RimI-like enzyme